MYWSLPSARSRLSRSWRYFSRRASGSNAGAAGSSTVVMLPVPPGVQGPDPVWIAVLPSWSMSAARVVPDGSGRRGGGGRGDGFSQVGELAVLDDVVDEPVGHGVRAAHDVVPVDVGRDPVHGLVRGRGEDVDHPAAHLDDLGHLDL